MPSDSSRSVSSVSSASSSAENAVEEAGPREDQAREQEGEEAPEDDTALDERVDGDLRQAQNNDQRTVYLWTFSHTSKPGRAKPSDYSTKGFSNVVMEAYVHTGKSWEQWLCVREAHPLSKSALEREWHLHLAMQTMGKIRWLEPANYLRQKYQIFASVQTASARNSYESAVAYLVCPSRKKSREDLDPDPLFSPGHEPLPDKLQARREGTRRIQAAELYETVTRHQLDTVTKLFAYAARQHAAGD